MKSGAVASLLVVLCWPLTAQEPTAPRSAPTPPTLHVRGRVLDEEGAPIAGAGVLVAEGHAATTDAALDAPQMRSGADGTFSLTLPKPDLLRASVVIAAEKRVGRRIPTATWIYEGRADGTTTIDLGDRHLPKGVTLVGRVRGAEGQPLPVATIAASDLVTRQYWGDSFGVRTTSDADGFFRLRGVFATAMSLQVHAPGHYSERLPWIGVGMPLDVQLAPSGVIEGSVSEADAIGAGHRVCIASEFVSDFNLFEDSVPVVDGRFVIDVRRRGRFKLWLSDADGLVVAQSELLDAPARDVVIDTAAADQGSMRVRAIDAASREPVAGLRASAFLWGTPDNLRDECMLVHSARPAEADGSVLLRLFARFDKISLFAVADGHAPSLRAIDSTSQNLVLEMTRAGRIEGRFEAPRGASLDELEIVFTWTEPNPESPLPADTFALRRPALARIDADGTFAIEGLAPGRYSMLARYRGGTACVSQTIDVAAATTTGGVRTALPTGVPVAATIRGTPANHGGWRLLASADESTDPPNASPWPGVTDTARTAGTPIVDGVARWPHLAPGPNRLTLIVPANVRGSGQLRLTLPDLMVEAGTSDVEIDVRDHLPGALRVTLDLGDVDVPPGRLAVVASSPTTDEARRRAPTPRCWALAGPDGSATVLTTPGIQLVSVHDIVTGIEVLRLDEPVQIAPGGTHALELRVPLGIVRVQFDPPPKGLLPVQSLSVLAADQRQWDSDLPFASMHGGAGIDYSGTMVDLPLLLPPGAVTLQPQGGADSIDLGAISGSASSQMERTTIEVQAGEKRTVTLPLPEQQPMRER